MSYILDALRRADAERERGGVPGLHSQAAGAARDDDEAPRSAAPPWAWIAIGLAAGLAIVLVWLMLGRSGAADPVVAAAPPLPVTPLPEPTLPPPPVQAAPAPAVQAPVAAPPPPVRTPQRAVDILPRVAPATSPTPTPTPAPAPAVAKPPAAPAAAAPATAKVATAAPAGEAAASEPRVMALRELPDEVRRALPSLAIGGAMYSQNAASRFLMINGQLFHENDALTPELTLRQIKLKSAVLEFRGYRYEVNY